MDDVQSQSDNRRVALDEVGVSGIRYPIVVLDRARERQETIGRITMSVSLPQHFKGTHMSRFVEVLNEHRGEVTMQTLPTILGALRDRLDAETAYLEVAFPYFLERAAPISGARGLMDYECWFKGALRGGEPEFTLGVGVPVTSLCPCSKQISDYGAHNQRGQIRIEVRSTLNEERKPNLIWIEELVTIAERSGSAPVYPLLKRADERFVTMQAYDNPVFVEDMVRNVAVQLRDDSRVAWFEVTAENQESIHNHSAYAKTSWVRAAAVKQADLQTRLRGAHVHSSAADTVLASQG